MTLEEIRTKSAQWEDLNPCKQYQGRVANELAAQVAHLLKMVDALATGASEDSCPYAYHDRQGEKCEGCKIEGATIEEAKQIEACWIEWADAQAGGEDES